MAQCCQRSIDQLDVWKVKQSRLDFLCTKPLVYVSIITALAVAILGAFALLGFFYPMSCVGGLGELLGDIGAIALLGVGLTLFAILITARSCHVRARREERAEETADIQIHQPSVNDFY